MDKRDYYQVLGVERDAGPEAIKTAYRNLALKFHPDRRPNDPGAEETFKEAAEAYEVLRDSEKRRIYDRGGHEGLAGAGFSGFTDFHDIFTNFGDLFAELFGSGSSGTNEPGRGRDLRFELELGFEDAALGLDQEFRILREEDCGACRGSGSASGHLETCPFCGGQGRVYQFRGLLNLTTACPECRGAGRMVSDPCPECSGSGRIVREKRLALRIPPGVDTGSRLRLRGEGDGGRWGGPPGDLFVVMLVRPHVHFEREGDHVLAMADVSMVQAALGGEIDVPTLSGSKRVSIPQGTQNGDVIRIKGAGFPNLHGNGRGDQILEMRVKIPRRLSRRQEELLRELAALEGKRIPAEDKSFARKVMGKIKAAVG